MGSIEGLLDFLEETESLKKTIRYSSCPENVQEPTAGHVWKVSLMVPLLAEKFRVPVDILHALQISNAHDLGECGMKYDFDSYLVSKGKLDQNDKDLAEENYMKSVKNRFSFGEQLYGLWREYEENKTYEAKFVRAIDKLEALIHVITTKGTGRDINDIEYVATYADRAVEDVPELKPFLRALKVRLRPVAERQGLIWTKEFDYPD